MIDMNLNISAPHITDMQDPVEILRQRLAYRRKTEKSFSVLRACRNLYRLSPTLITLILKGKRKITPDRVDALCKLMGLHGAEKTYFKNLVLQSFSDVASESDVALLKQRSRKNVSTHILSDWLNVYVKDCFHIEAIQKNPKLLYRQLGPLASNKRIEKSLQFLLKEGHLRRTPEGHIVIETNLTVTEPLVPSQKVRNFHKAALKIAQQAIDLHGPSERFANTLLVCVSKDRLTELNQITQEFAEKLKEFAEVSTPEDDRLYQLIVNISPTGGKVE
jgi:uncharacterized protein (TIGR02147 family)